MTKAEKTRQFIIEQAAPLFNTKGIAGTAISDIMAATKMAKGGIYGNFESKEELTYAIVDYNLKQLAASVVAAVAKGNTAREKLLAYVDFFKNPVQYPILGGCPVLNFGVEADDTNPVIRQKVKGLIEAGQSLAEGIIRKGIEAGEFKETFDARSFSIFLFTALEGGILIGRVMHSNHQMRILIGMLKNMIDEQLL
jgi:TetR/AcrR family transcriptional repressor of nem operon